MAFARPIPSETFRRFDRLAFVARQPARAGAGGEHYARRPAPSTDFVDYRPYQPGDDFRRVDWNVYGRLGSLQVKVTEGRERLNVLIVLDCSSSMAFGTPEKLEFGAHVAAALAYVGMARADSVSVACLGAPASRIGPFARRTRTPALVRQLSEIAPTGAVDVNRGLASCLPKDGNAPPLAVIVSDLLTPGGVADGLDKLQARRADVAVIHVVSADEIDPNLTGELQLIDAESGSAVELGVSLETLAAYRSRFGTWLDERAGECRARGIRYVRVRTDRPLASVLLDDLRRGGLVR